MKTLKQIQLNPKLKVIEHGFDGGCAYWQPTKNTRPAVIIFSWGRGWDHVSVSFSKRCPTWEEMCQVKDMFFKDSEMAIQYHPAKEDYINCHPFCLHIWRPQGTEIQKPPSIMVGV